MQPFVISYNSQESIAHAQRMNTISDIILGGGAAPSLTDVFALDTACKISMPTNESQTQRTIEAFAVLLAVLPGVQDPLFLAYNDDVVRAYKTNFEHIEACVQALPTLPICSMILRWIQLRFQVYWTDGLKGPTEPPNFKELYSQIRFKSWIPPSIPAVYLTDHHLALDMTGGAAPQQPPLAGALISGPAQPPSVGAITSATPLAGAPGLPATGASTEGTQNPIEWNTAADARIKAKSPIMGTLKNFLLQAGGGQEPAVVPNHDDGLDMCLAYQCRGSCYTTYRRRTAHKKLKATDATRLLSFVEAGLARG
jgi:hypothetical protein